MLSSSQTLSLYVLSHLWINSLWDEKFGKHPNDMGKRASERRRGRERGGEKEGLNITMYVTLVLCVEPLLSI